MKHDLTTGTWQDDNGCPISIVLAATSDDVLSSMVAKNFIRDGVADHAHLIPRVLLYRHQSQNNDIGQRR